MCFANKKAIKVSTLTKNIKNVKMFKHQKNIKRLNKSLSHDLTQGRDGVWIKQTNKQTNWAQYSSGLQNSNKFWMLRISLINFPKNKFFSRKRMQCTEHACEETIIFIQHFTNYIKLLCKISKMIHNNVLRVWLCNIEMTMQFVHID
jgi:hypothetical protein